VCMYIYVCVCCVCVSPCPEEKDAVKKAKEMEK
jgi:hypothetical protein